MKLVHVAVGVVLRADQVFICLRPDHVHQGGKWEFPGGKVDKGETVETALTRELAEEIGIKISACSPLAVIEHDYGDKHVRLDVYTVSEFTGEPFGKEGQQSRWCNIADLDIRDFPVANGPIINALLAKSVE